MSTPNPPVIAGLHDSPATIERNHFAYKSLSTWSFNLFIGCVHGCRFCYVPETSTNKLKPLLSSYGVVDPVADWGSYVLVRPWDEHRFMASLQKAEKAPAHSLNPDGNRAVFLCSTTDPYQVIRNPDSTKQSLLNQLARANLRRALEAIRDHSTLNVRILTRSPLARNDFDVFKTLGNRLIFGTSLPTMDSNLGRLYEPKVPAPAQRLKLLVDANNEGIPTYVAVAPVFPEVGYEGLLEVFNSVKAANPRTIFMEPVNLRLGIAERIQKEARKLGREIDMTPYHAGPAWSQYAIRALREAERAAKETGQLERLHLWPDHTALNAMRVVQSQPDPAAYLAWLQSYWDRISEWPGKSA